MQKFIVTANGEFRYGDVGLHKHLLRNGDVCIGGGFYSFDHAHRHMLLSGRSYDFGRVKWSWIDQLRIPQELEGYEPYYEDLPLSAFVEVLYTK